MKNLLLLLLLTITLFGCSCSKTEDAQYLYVIKYEDCRTMKWDTIEFTGGDDEWYINTYNQAVPILQQISWITPKERKLNVCDFEIISKHKLNINLNQK